MSNWGDLPELRKLESRYLILRVGKIIILIKIQCVTDCTFAVCSVTTASSRWYRHWRRGGEGGNNFKFVARHQRTFLPHTGCWGQGKGVTPPLLMRMNTEGFSKEVCTFIGHLNCSKWLALRDKFSGYILMQIECVWTQYSCYFGFVSQKQRNGKRTGILLAL